MIDIGGPAMLRAAAKSFASVVAVCRPQDYEPVLEQLWSGRGVDDARAAPSASRRSRSRGRPRTTRRSRAGSSRVSDFPETFVPSFDRELELPYGENPHQEAAYYAERGARTHLLAFVEQLQGKALSFNNLNDLSAARLLMSELEGPACVIVKHANPCGVGVAGTIEEAYAKALAADPVSAYGGVVVLNRTVSSALAEALADQFVEVLFAPGYEAPALERIGTQAVVARPRAHGAARGRTRASSTTGACSAAFSSRSAIPRCPVATEMQVACGEVSDAQWDDLVFAWIGSSST